MDTMTRNRISYLNGQLTTINEELYRILKAEEVGFVSKLDAPKSKQEETVAGLRIAVRQLDSASDNLFLLPD